MRHRILLLLATATTLTVVRCRGADEDRSLIDTGLVSRFLQQHRRYIVDNFNNGTASFRETFESAGEPRGKKKQLKRMNKTLMAVVMAYTMKFMFLLPSFIGTLVLLKFSMGLTGFFYALFAAVLGLEHKHH